MNVALTAAERPGGGDAPAAAAQAPHAAIRAPARAVPRRGLEVLDEMAEERDALGEVLGDIRAVGDGEVAGQLGRLSQRLSEFAPAVTMIGQVKAGKTMLVNAMAGRPGLLPSDVNPWTSVVTSLHLNHARPEGAPRAAFRFFDEGEWDRLMRNGGRIGELALRAGAEGEAEELRAQVAEMREKTKARLGRRFELMLGQTHDYESFDDALVKRYVCMGDDYDELSQAEKQGQFADITRSADLWLGAPFLSVPLTIRDTPGVNDTFMMREQITIRALRDSRTCVVVLSAHQALNTTDMGLIRLISNLRSRDVIVFVNRVDELSDPETQIAEIEASLSATLADKVDGPLPEIVFGSALWAEAVLAGTVDALVVDSARALVSMASSRSGQDLAALSVEDMVWELSGLPALWGAIGRRLDEGAWAALVKDLAERAASNVVALKSLTERVSLRATDGEMMPPEESERLLSGIGEDALGALEGRLGDILARFRDRVDQVHESFLDRALADLLSHLEAHGEKAVWSYSPDGLRLLIRSAYQVMRRRTERTCEEIYSDAARRMLEAQARILAVEVENQAANVPATPDLPQPIALAQTIALDLKTSWWKSWWGRRRGYEAFAADFRDLIAAETAPIVEELKGAQTEEVRRRALGALEGFVTDQKRVIGAMRAKSEISIGDLNAMFGVEAQEELDCMLDMLLEELGVSERGEQAERMRA
ncbi:dynamin family protein [Hasllibacter halocynthiae]|uniref:Dynamin family protein n=1 Tax=Hasllibacter halocynthiae TaxID=595589 RepID=A0A2T0WZ02_9RHOB|nr:dynamin family protein [Hasllibacter halocynthiae]PRY91920.1 dynamin family protein [Hasllibacter halocynthiae]